MSKQIKAHPIRHNDSSIGAREIALASLGAASLARKQAVKSFAEFSAFANRLPEASAILLEGFGERTQALKDTVVEKVGSLRKRAGNVAQIANGEFEQRIAPLLARLGVKGKPAKRKQAPSKGRAKSKRKSATKRSRKVA